MPRERSFSHSLLGPLFVLGAFFAVVLSAGSAHADRIAWKKTTIKESNSSWNLECDFYLNKPPDVAHVPMQFKFEKDVYYERSLVDGNDKPQLRKVPLENEQPLIEGVEVGFMDSSGKAQARTRFSFKLTRDRDFAAGEYRVTVTDKNTGRKIGTEQRLILEGENEVIDRRSMVFDSKKADDKAKANREAKAKASAEEDAYDPKADPEKDDYWASGPSEPEKRDEPLPPPAHMQEHPGACGCRMVGAKQNGAELSWLALGAVGLVLARRRKAA
jgi:hypothetical protein